MSAKIQKSSHTFADRALLTFARLHHKRQTRVDAVGGLLGLLCWCHLCAWNIAMLYLIFVEHSGLLSEVVVERKKTNELLLWEAIHRPSLFRPSKVPQSHDHIIRPLKGTSANGTDRENVRIVTRFFLPARRNQKMTYPYMTVEGL
jgi:hypothetical protein